MGEVIRLQAGDRLRVALVSLEEFATFVRQEHYFKEEFWQHGVRPEARGGDEVLRRLGFQWHKRSSPVWGITWFEAAAFCESQGGRLPWYKEWQEFVVPPRPQAPQRGWFRWVGPGSPPPPERVHPERQSGLLEWCADWYDPNFNGPEVQRPRGWPPMRRVAGRADERADPHYVGAKVGFRVVYPPQARRL